MVASKATKLLNVVRRTMFVLAKDVAYKSIVRPSTYRVRSNFRGTKYSRTAQKWHVRDLIFAVDQDFREIYNLGDSALIVVSAHRNKCLFNFI